jgi:alpha-D-xyloside xylohydrolase
VYNVVLAGGAPYIEAKDGVIVFTDPQFTGISCAVKLEVVSENIIRVIAAPEKKFLHMKAL